jgi:acyl dehydratase
MPISSKHILSQGPALAGIGRTALSALTQQLEKKLGKTNASAPVQTPTEELTAIYSPPPTDLIRDYVRHVGGDPSEYKKTVPPHLFPQWSFGLASQTLKGIPYPLMRVMNGGCTMVVNAPIPNDRDLVVKTCLESIDDNGRRAVLCQRIVTGTPETPNAVVAHLYAIVPLKSGVNGSRKRSEKPRVPEDVRELAYWKIGANAGLDFAKLTGDFNPVHWVRSYAKASGFKNTILHGFATMARAYEGLNRKAFKGSRSITRFDVKFTRPLVLPAKVGLYVDSENAVYVGDAPGGPAYMIGHYEAVK